MPIQHAQLHWDDQGQPLSSTHDDVYFSRESGLEETRYVFLQHNALPERFAALRAGDCLVVGETGFGTGLNFLCCWALFEQQAVAGARLHFISVEKFPLQPDDLRKALALWPQLERYSNPLLQAYQVIQPGMQTLLLADGRVQLTVLIGEASEQLAQLDGQVNAWFLDGFAPSKNPDMWSEALFSQLARLSAPDATLATFTSAGFVRRGLQAAGFAMQRSKGFGHKREMLSGTLETAPLPSWRAPWFARSVLPELSERHALVIGGGLAGCSTAFSLARRGWRVTVLEAGEHLATAASGNAQGMLYLKLSAAHTPLSQLVLAGFGYSRRLLEHWQESQQWQACGLLQLAWNEQESKRQQQLAQAFSSSLLRAVDADEASQLAGIELAAGGLFYPDSGWVSPAHLCRWLVSHPLISVVNCARISRLSQHQGLWQASGEDGRSWHAPVVVLANAADARQLPQAAHLPLKAIRGQTSLLSASDASAALRCVVSAEGYIAPAHNGLHCTGASFVFDPHSSELTALEQADNIQRLQQLSPALYQAMGGELLHGAPVRGHAALRCTTPDYLPLIGPLADANAFGSTYARLRQDARWQAKAPCPRHTGLYVNLAHGSRGLITAPLAGELLAAQLCHEPLPIPQAVADACHPDRFLLRALIRQQRPSSPQPEMPAGFC